MPMIYLSFQYHQLKNPGYVGGPIKLSFIASFSDGPKEKAQRMTKTKFNTEIQVQKIESLVTKVQKGDWKLLDKLNHTLNAKR